MSAGRAAPFLAAAASVVVGGCVSDAARAARSTEHELVARGLMVAWERADTAELFELFWPDAVYDDFPNQITYQGIEEIVGYVTQVHTWASDVIVNVTAVHVGDSSVVAEWVFAGIQDAPIEGVVSVGTGREIVLNGVTVIELDQGRITRAADYIDTAPLMLQLGGRIELPGGSTITLEGGR